jgi:hypothetical protein
LYGHYPYTTIRGRVGGWKNVKRIVQARTHPDLSEQLSRIVARSSDATVWANRDADHLVRQRQGHGSTARAGR